MSDDLVKKSKSAACNLKCRDIIRNGSDDAAEIRQSPEWVAADVLEETADRIEELEAVLRDVDAWVDDLMPYAQEGFEPANVFKRVKEVLNK